ncbi:hypothetical protein [Sellimonas intestinalis]|uniref:hypothetical protein n=1 Tax=Sellimonas intestinalis TaxID=1653434 RepID=UPI0039967DEA
MRFSVSANTKHPEEATDFALWLGSEEAQKINGEAGVCISARNDCQQYFVDAHESLNCQIFLDNVANAELLPHCKITSQLSQVEKKYLEPAWKGETKLADACKSVAEEQNKLLEEMNAK